MENKGQVRKMKENQWKTQGKASQTEKKNQARLIFCLKNMVLCFDNIIYYVLDINIYTCVFFSMLCPKVMMMCEDFERPFLEATGVRG